MKENRGFTLLEMLNRQVHGIGIRSLQKTEKIAMVPDKRIIQIRTITKVRNA